MIQELQLRLLPEIAGHEGNLRNYLAAEQGIDLNSLISVRILKRSIDARHGQVLINLKVRLYINEVAKDEAFLPVEYKVLPEGAPQAVVVGAGPAGLFAALRLIELGVKPIVVERGKDVHERKVDIARISREQTVDPDSNYSFGEGGAGAFSDGKLYTRSKKRGNTDRILRIFCQHGASTDILVDAHPHVGTDKLPRVIENMRNTILTYGGEVHFQCCMEDFILQTSATGEQQVVGIRTRDGKEFEGPVLLATGHSARDVYECLHRNNILLEAKGIAVGVRVEHPAELIDQIQYHSPAGRGEWLPAAEYSFVTQVRDRGVYSFCMCPGGFVVPAASGPSQVVVNGMSPSNRGSKWSNSGIVVEFRPEDLPEQFAEQGVLGMMRFQEDLEKQCWLQGGSKQIAPAQRLVDFTRRKLGTTLPESSYTPGLISSPLHFWLPEDISTRLSEGLQEFGRNSRGFLTNEACVIGVETRTSSPVRILRANDTLQHVTFKGLYPCGEGAGYAGGIVSAGIDGERCAESLASLLK